MRKAIIKNKKVTMDDLAVLMTKGFERVDKMIADGREETSDLARMVARGFERVDKEIGEVKEKLGKVEDRLGKVEDRLGKVEDRLGKVEDNLTTTRMDVLGIGDRFVSKHEFNQHLIRFSLLEEKVKTKK